MTPWTALGQTGKLFDRVFRGGGGICVIKLGPKEARSEIVGVPLADIPYWRAGVRGMFQAGCDLFCRKTYVIEMKKAAATTFNPFLLLLDVGGKVVAQDDDSGENKNAKIRFTAKQSGTYKVVATSSIGQQIGAYHLSVTAVPPEKKE